jgi:hypothetical protein
MMTTLHHKEEFFMIVIKGTKKHTPAYVPFWGLVRTYALPLVLRYSWGPDSLTADAVKG